MLPERKNCPDCGSPLGKGAYKCRCGWVGSEPAAARPHIACCYSECMEGATVRVWTRTGWANVCLSHYGLVERVPRRADSVLLREIRAKYEKSVDYARRNPGEKKAA